MAEEEGCVTGDADILLGGSAGIDGDDGWLMCCGGDML